MYPYNDDIQHIKLFYCDDMKAWMYGTKCRKMLTLSSNAFK